MQYFIQGCVLLFVGILITGCAGKLPTLPLESSERAEKAKRFQLLDDRANIYLRLNSGGWGQPIKISVNNQDLGVIDPNHYINFNAPLGRLHIKNVIGVKVEGAAVTAEFDLTVSESSVILIQCEPTKGFGIIYRTSEPVLHNKSKCSPSEWTQKNGFSACIKPYENPAISGEEALTEPWASCALVDDKQVFLDSVLVKAKAVKFKRDQEEDAKQAKQKQQRLTKEDYLRAEQAHTVVSYEQFLSKYPTGHYSGVIRGKVQALRISEQANVLLQRYEKLPLQIKKDKMMLTMTGHLKRERYQESLPYFEALNRLGVKLSPSFTYFWGEALVQTGKNKEGLEKLYVYIAEEGAQGQYYSQALTLTNETER